MKIDQKRMLKEKTWETIRDGKFNAAECDLVLAFGSNNLIKDRGIYQSIRDQYPNADLVMNSTAGEIIDTCVNDESISLTAVKFDRSHIHSASVNIKEHANSFGAGVALAQKVDTEGLKSVLVISDGHWVNGSELVTGLLSVFPKETIITGGLAGDGTRFQSTLVGLNELPGEGVILIIGFYGSLVATYGSVGGWDTFGPERLITKSKSNVLFELDHKPALEIYKRYLGEQANDLPGSALLYPLSIRNGNKAESVVRTILDVNETENSLTFAGNMPEGNYARLMKANFDRLIEGSSGAARQSQNGAESELAILISCVGRKLVLGQRIEEEVEVVRSVFGDKIAITGFYSYGEIAPSFKFAKCELHNQTMTITTLTEA